MISGFCAKKGKTKVVKMLVLVAINMFMIIKSLSCIDIFVFVVYGLTGSDGSLMWKLFEDLYLKYKIYFVGGSATECFN